MDFELDCYELNYIKRTGGVYVKKNLNFKVADRTTTAIGNLLELLTLEIYMEKKNNVIVSCIYRAPGSNLNILKEWMEEMIYTAESKQQGN